MVIRKQNISKQWGRKEQRYCNSTEENGNHTGQTQHGPSQIPPNIGVGQEYGKGMEETNSREPREMKEVLWCFVYIKEKKGEKYNIEAYDYGVRGIQRREYIYRCKCIVKPAVLHLKSRKIAMARIDEIKEIIRLRVWNDKEYGMIQKITKGMNGDTRWI
jgi:hypothetical protein